MKMKHFFAALALTACLAAPAFADGGTVSKKVSAQCVTLDDLKRDFSHPNFSVVVLEGADAQAYITAYNNDEPRSDLKVDVVAFVYVKGEDNVFSAVFLKGCAIGHATMSRGLIYKYLTLGGVGA